MIIAFEGGDRAGKTTQFGLLKGKLLNCVPRRYPNRQDSALGPLINDYLAGKVNLSNQTATLLLAACLWQEEHLPDQLYLYDRYKASCTAYSVARGMPMEQAKMLTQGLPDPDLTIYLRLPPAQAKLRSGFGQERFDREDFQLKVTNCLDALVDSKWIIIDASQSIDEIAQQIWQKVAK